MICFDLTEGDVTQTTEAYRDHLNERVKETFRKEKEKIMRKLRERRSLRTRKFVCMTDALK